METNPRKVRKALGAGRWFPGDGSQLRQMIRQCMDAAHPPQVTGRIVSAIAPHAGYVYSGPVAGYTFRTLADQAAAQGSPDTAVILGFSHRGSFSGVALMDGDAIATPLGEVPLDTAAADYLVGQNAGIVKDYAPHVWEHSAENEIPFAQAALPDTKLVVALLGDHRPGTIDGLVRALQALAKIKRTVVVASSDMLHDPSYEKVTKTDRMTLEKVAAMDVDGVQRMWSQARQVFCGIGPVTAAMQLARAQGCAQGQVLYYRNSGDDFPESRGEWVVGYGAVVFAA